MWTAHRWTGTLGLAALACLVLAGPARAADPPATPVTPELVIGPSVVHQVTPEYPDSLVEAGVSGTVQLLVQVTATGSVGEVRVVDGPRALAPYAVAAMRQWRFTPDQSSGKPASCWVKLPVRFDPAQHVKSVSEWPEPLVRVPLVTAADGFDPNGPPFVGVVRFDVGADGFVHGASFMGPAPAHADAILARARRWVWTPGRDASGAPIATWTSLRVTATPEAIEIARPDSSLGGVLGAANYANVKLVGSSGKGVQRDMDPLALAHVFAGWLSDPKAYAGTGPWQSHCPVRFDALLTFDGPGGSLRAEFARACAWMQVTTRDRVLFVPYGPIHERIDAAFASLFSDSSGARAPTPAPAAGH